MLNSTIYAISVLMFDKFLITASISEAYIQGKILKMMNISTDEAKVPGANHITHALQLQKNLLF